MSGLRFLKSVVSNRPELKKSVYHDHVKLIQFRMGTIQTLGIIERTIFGSSLSFHFHFPLCYLPKSVVVCFFNLQPDLVFFLFLTNDILALWCCRCRSRR